MSKNIKISEPVAFAEKPEFGYCILSEEYQSVGRWLNTKKKTCLLKGKLTDLRKFYAVNKELPGRIATLEVRATEWSRLQGVKSAEEADRYFSKLTDSAADAVEFVTADGEIILRQNFYDPTGLVEDVLVPHANEEEIRERYKVLEARKKEAAAKPAAPTRSGRRANLDK